MINKVIHYIWLGGKEEPEILQKCKASWKKYCPDYEIKRWDESNLDLDECKYAREAYEAKKFAFASDYLRLKVLYNEGGIYLDVDVKLLKPLDDFLNEQFFTGFEKGDKFCVAPGLICGAEKGSPVLKDILDSYTDASFIKEDGNYDLTTICERTTSILEKFGLKRIDQTQRGEGWVVFASEYFCPLSWDKIEKKKTKNTHSIHLYYASWKGKKSLKEKCKWLLKKVLGRKRYNKIMERRYEKKDSKKNTSK